MLTLEYLNTLSKKDYSITVLSEFRKCKKDIKYLIENYFTVIEPTLSIKIPFKLYSHQITAVDDFQNFRYNLTMKSRQMGFTTITAAYVAAYMCLNSNKEIAVVATKMHVSRKFLKAVKIFLDDARKIAPWLVSGYTLGDNGKDSFTLNNNNHIRAETNNENACRGDVISLLCLDESIDSQTVIEVRNKITGEIKKVKIGEVFDNKDIFN